MAGSSRDYRQSLKTALFITAVFFCIELAGGVVSGSLALVSDAGHMFSDVIALLLSFMALTLAEQIPTKERTYGFHRAEIFAAFINSVLLMAVSAGIAWEAWNRVVSPQPVQGVLMGAVAVAGLAANLAIIFMLHGSSDLNIRSAFLHVAGDTVSSVMVILAAAWITLTGQVLADPVLSVAIAALILFSAAGILRETVAILLQFTPRDVDFDAVITEMTSVPGVDGVHHVHLWSLCSDINVLDAHVFTCERDAAKAETIKQEIKRRLQKFRILHSALEFECEECENCQVAGSYSVRRE